MVQDQRRLDPESDEPQEGEVPHLRVSPRKVTLVLGGISLLLTFIGLVAGLLNRDFGRPFVLATFQRLFDLNGEGNIPAWFSASLLLLSSLLLAIIAIHTRQTLDKYRWHWAVLALIFLFLSVDEAARLHEVISRAIRVRLAPQGALKSSWVLPYSVFALVVAAFYTRFLLHLPAVTRRLLLFAATLYIGGALGMEIVGAVRLERPGWGKDGNLRYTVPIEEFCEMLGVVVFIHALLSHLGARTGELRIGISRR